MFLMIQTDVYNINLLALKNTVDHITFPSSLICLTLHQDIYLGITNALKDPPPLSK